MDSEQIRLNITPEIIAVAKPRHSGHCVIADALRAALPNVRRVSVDLQTVRFTDPETRRRYIFLTPAKAQALLVNWDLGIPPEPSTMKLGRPAQIMHIRSQSRSAAKAKVKRKIKAQDARRPLPSGTRKVVSPVTQNGAAPIVLGGNYPPTAVLSSTRGRIRTFGLRSLQP